MIVFLSVGKAGKHLIIVKRRTRSKGGTGFSAVPKYTATFEAP